MYPNEKYYELHKERINTMPPPEPKTFDNQIFLGASLVMRSIEKNERLLKILEEVFPGKCEIIFSLVEYYLIRRESASQLYKHYLYNHCTTLYYISNKIQLSKLFNEYVDHDIISSFLFKWLNYHMFLKALANRIDIDFDSTNRNVSSKNMVKQK